MKEKNIRSAWKEFQNIMSFAELQRTIELPSRILGQDLQGIIPSIIMDESGLKINSLFLVTEDYLCEVNVLPHTAFDLCPKRNVYNWKLSINDLEVIKNAKEIAEANARGQSSPAKKVERYKTAKLRLRHAQGLESTFTYIGQSPTDWVNAALSLLPLSLMKESVSQSPFIDSDDGGAE